MGFIMLIVLIVVVENLSVCWKLEVLGLWVCDFRVHQFLIVWADDAMWEEDYISDPIELLRFNLYAESFKLVVNNLCIFNAFKLFLKRILVFLWRLFEWRILFSEVLVFREHLFVLKMNWRLVGTKWGPKDIFADRKPRLSLVSGLFLQT